MKKQLPMIKPLIFACSVALAACSSSSNDSVAPVTTVAGVAEAPQGVIAQLEYHKSLLVAAVEFAFPAAIAGITGLEPVTGATVELIRIDDDGNQVGDVLASTSTSITGEYSLALPTGVSLAGNLIVRITGNGGASMSAMVVDQAVDINPISQFVLDKFVDDENLVLADLAINDVVALSGKVEEFDLTATSDLSTMLALLEAEVGEFVDNEIAVIDSTPDDGTAVAAAAGKWHSAELGMGMHDADSISFGTFSLDTLSEELTFSGSGNTDPNLTITTGPVIVDSFSNFMNDNFSSFSLYHESDIGGTGGENIPANIDADGNISLSFGFEEELQTVDTLVDIDGPDYGWRYPPSTHLLKPAAGANIYVNVWNEAGVRYETTDTNSDGVKDAIDPDKRDGDEVSFDLSVFLKEGSSMTAADLSGEYGGVFLNLNVDTAPEAVVDSTVGQVSFDGVDTVNRAVDAFHVREITRTPAIAPAVNLVHAASTEPASLDSFTYTVSATGMVTLNTPGGVLEGYASNDGGVIAIVDDEATGTDPVTNVNNEMLIFVKLGSSVDTNKVAVLGGASYRLYSLSLNASENGSSGIFSIGNGLMTFDAGATAANVTGTSRGVERSSDVSQVSKASADAINETLTISSISPKGKITMSATNGSETITLRGFVSEDKNLVIFRMFNDDAGTDQAYELGLVIGVKQ